MLHAVEGGRGGEVGHWQAGSNGVRLARRLGRLEAKAATTEGPIVIVYEAEPGVWTTYDGERITREDMPANAQLIVFRRRPDGPQLSAAIWRDGLTAARWNVRAAGNSTSPGSRSRSSKVGRW